MSRYRSGKLEPHPAPPPLLWAGELEAALFLQQVRLFQAEVALDVWRSPRFGLPALQALPDPRPPA